MGWLDLLFGKDARRRPKIEAPVVAKAKPKAKPRDRLEGVAGVRIVTKGAFLRAIVGESFYQSQLERVCKGHNRFGHDLEKVAVLTPDPDNEHDPNAVAVSIDGGRVGFLGREDAARYLAALEEAGYAGQAVKVAAIVKGGWRTNQHDSGHFGVWLALPWPVKFAV